MTKEQILNNKLQFHSSTRSSYDCAIEAMDEWAAIQNKVLIDALNQICSMKREAGETTDTYAFNRCWHIATDALASYAEQAPQENDKPELVELPMPVGDFILKQTDLLPIVEPDGNYWHYSKVCVMLDRYLKYKRGGQVTGKSAGAEFIAEAEWKRRDFGNKMYAENWWSNAPVDVRVAIEDMLIYYDQMLGSLNQSKEAGKQPEHQPIDRRLFEAVPVEKELPPVQSGFSRPIIVICTDTLSNTSEEQLKEAKFLSPNIDNSDPEFSFNDPNSQLFSSDKVTHWLREVKPRSVQTEVLGKQKDKKNV